MVTRGVRKYWSLEIHGVGSFYLLLFLLSVFNTCKVSWIIHSNWAVKVWVWTVVCPGMVPCDCLVKILRLYLCPPLVTAEILEVWTAEVLDIHTQHGHCDNQWIVKQGKDNTTKLSFPLRVFLYGMTNMETSGNYHYCRGEIYIKHRVLEM